MLAFPQLSGHSRPIFPSVYQDAGVPHTWATADPCSIGMTVSCHSLTFWPPQTHRPSVNPYSCISPTWAMSDPSSICEPVSWLFRNIESQYNPYSIDITVSVTLRPWHTYRPCVLTLCKSREQWEEVRSYPENLNNYMLDHRKCHSGL